jgi:hypothetical protein
MSETPHTPSNGSLGGTPASPKAVDLGDIPDGWDDETEGSDGAVSPASDSLAGVPEPAPIAPEVVATGTAEVPKRGGETDAENTPFTADDLSDVSAATEDDMKSSVGRSDETDLNEDFESYSKAASQGEKALRKRMFSLEQRLHSVDLEDNERTWLWLSPFIGEVADVMADHLGISKGKVFEAAILMFYRNCFSMEKRMLADMGLMLDSSTLQNQELAIEISALEDLANMAMQAEASPLNQVPEETK